MIITIDGPSASGKSTIAHALAKRLNFYYLDSGLFYRALGYLLVSQAGYTVPDLASRINDKDINYYTSRCNYVYDQAGAHIFYEEEDITPCLKTKDVDLYASLIGGTPNVRLGLEAYMRILAQDKNLVIDGRDTGTIVFPNAEYKFFLTASLAVRAVRWQVDQGKKGIIVTLEQAEHAVKTRDDRDWARPVAPLAIPKDAHIIDNTNLSQEQTLQEFLKIIT